MTTAYVADRARQLLDDGWVRDVTDLGGGRVLARVGGYRVVRTRAGRFRCDCAASCYGSDTCSHREALRLALEERSP